MLSLVLIFAAHAILRFPGDNPWAASVICGILLVAMGIARRFGAWNSVSSAWAWLTADSRFLVLIVSAPVTMVAMSTGSGTSVSYNHVVAYAIEAFFFAYAFIAALRAFWATGIGSIASWFRR
jgi:hypothetical protein